MKATPTRIAGVMVIEPVVYEDSRGAFFESYNERALEQLGIRERFVQDNQSVSKQNVLRGLHYQIQQPQGKLVRCLRGEVFDVAVDLRRRSSTFGQWTGVTLSGESRAALWIPAGFAHGFLALSDNAEMLYKTTDFYAPKHERTILWNDPTLEVAWPIRGQPLISGKDLAGSLLEQAEVFE